MDTNTNTMNNAQIQTETINCSLPFPIHTIHITYGTVLDPFGTVGMTQLHAVQILDIRQNVLFYWRQMSALVLSDDQRENIQAYSQQSELNREITEDGRDESRETEEDFPLSEDEER